MKSFLSSDALVPPQCRTVKITILGDEGVPVQVDGEAWIQPPGYIKIIHKNRTQTLTRDRVSREGPRVSARRPAGRVWLSVFLRFPGVRKHPEVVGGQTEVRVPQKPAGPGLAVLAARAGLRGRGPTHQRLRSGSGSSHTQVGGRSLKSAASDASVDSGHNFLSACAAAFEKWRSPTTVWSRNWPTPSMPAPRPWTWSTPTPRAPG